MGRKMVTKTLELIFDFGSPNAYLCMKVLPELLDRTGADLVITPCLLGGIFKGSIAQVASARSGASNQCEDGQSTG